VNPPGTSVSIEQFGGIASAEDEEARVTKPGSAETQWKRQMMGMGTMSHNEGFGAGKGSAFSAARGGLDQVSDVTIAFCNATYAIMSLQQLQGGG
jgi:hypothetical protein